jgi:outer membrane receptor protein involved in Fe transport
MVSNFDGRYVAPDLNVGVYNVEATAKGFKGEKRVKIEVPVGRQMLVDLSLTPGQTTETVTVEGGAAQVETTTSEVSAQIGQAQMRELPLNGRNFEQLILLAPGVQQITSGEQDSFYGRAQAYSIAGSRPEGQELLLDSEDIQTFWGHGAGNSVMGTSLGVDAIGEFQVLTNDYSARFGGSGSVMNQTTRSGTNDWHGSAFEFIRNSALDAKNYFDLASRPIPDFRRNEFGGTLGGPIKKDKSFFFVNYEGLRQLLGETELVDLPDAQARQGIVNGINYNSLNPGIAAALALYPAPSPAATEIGGGIDKDVRIGYQLAREDCVNTRWDYTLGSKDNSFTRYVYDNGTMHEPFGDGGLGLYPQLSRGINQYLTIGDRHLASNTLVNDARFSFTRTHVANNTSVSNSALDFFPGENRQNGYLTIPGLNSLGPTAYTPGFNIQNTFAAGDDVVWTRGKHNISFGMEVRRQQSGVMNSVFTNGDWTFTGLQAVLADEPSSFLGALPGKDNSYRGFRETGLFPYFQDDWKVLPTLTLNLGLRYEFITNPTGTQPLCAYATPANPAETACVPFRVNAVYAFPFRHNALVKGWQYSIIANAHSGNPFTVFDGFDRADLGDNGGIGNSPGGGERPNLVPGARNNPKVGSVNEWYNPASFALQAPGTLGDLGRNRLIGPGFLDIDMTLAKTTQLTERLDMQFRCEVFNILNEFFNPAITLAAAMLSHHWANVIPF